MKCIVLHKYKVMPWMKTRDGSPMPDKACVRCGKIRYDWVMYITSAEGKGIGYYMGPQWDGQTAPSEYGTWDNYWKRMEIAKKELLRKAR